MAYVDIPFDRVRLGGYLVYFSKKKKKIGNNSPHHRSGDGDGLAFLTRENQ